MPLKPRLKYDPTVESYKYLKNLLQAFRHNLNVLKDVSKPLCKVLNCFIDKICIKLLQLQK